MEYSVQDMKPMQTQTEPNQLEIMTTAEVAKSLRASKPTVRRWAKKGSLVGFQVGERGEWKFHRRAVDAFLNKGLPKPEQDSITSQLAGESSALPGILSQERTSD